MVTELLVTSRQEKASGSMMHTVSSLWTQREATVEAVSDNHVKEKEAEKNRKERLLQDKKHWDLMPRSLKQKSVCFHRPSSKHINSRTRWEDMREIATLSHA